jgi:hypothetical protein
MSLTQTDKDWFSQQLKDVKTDIENTMKTAVFEMGKRVSRIEHAFSLVSRAARAEIVERAKKDHESLVKQMFDDANLLLLAPMSAGGDGVRARGPVSRDEAAISAFIKEFNSDFDVELNKTVGYRLVHKSRSAQVRRKAAASVLRHGKDRAREELGLQLQYDKSWELRTAQSHAHRFMSALKDAGGDLVKSKGVSKGFLIVNDVRLAPEYLVPRMARWDGLIKLVLQKLRGWGNRQPVSLSADVGVMSDVFGAEYAADRGIFDINDLQLTSYDDQGVMDEDMFVG